MFADRDMTGRRWETGSTLDEGESKELPYLFEKELVIKQNKRIYVVDKYIPNVISVIPMTLKFYSKYDQVDGTALKYFKIVDNSTKMPYEKFEYPILESHKYGWMQNSVLHDLILASQTIQHRKSRSDITIFGEKLMCNRATERAKFNGKPFHLR